MKENLNGSYSVTDIAKTFRGLYSFLEPAIGKLFVVLITQSGIPL
jgi:hypothetical protein